jgi:hypothetical protein
VFGPRDRATWSLEGARRCSQGRCSCGLDRIGRSLAHVVGLVGDLQKHGIGLKVLTGDVDTTTATGRLVFGIFATLAEFERDLIHERTMAGLAEARARGRSGGRPRVMTKPKLKVAMTMMADRDNAARDVAAQLGVSLSTLYAYVDAKGEPRLRAVAHAGRGPKHSVKRGKIAGTATRSFDLHRRDIAVCCRRTCSSKLRGLGQ